ncbi:MAG: hypothetical protein JSW58_15225 [Candidatus Latescibacterota bacterium]|nr:MAG: hypothetical protein JSW58_15225 [Candidatus Latescibacterota bacterium]
MKRISLVLVFVLVLFAFRPSFADSYAVSYSPWVYVYAGALIVNSGTALGNGISVATGNADRRNGQFGFVIGAASTVLAGVMYGVDHESEYSEEAALMLGGTGLVAAVAGALAIRTANRQETASRFSPTVWPRRRGVSVGLTIQF